MDEYFPDDRRYIIHGGANRAFSRNSAESSTFVDILSAFYKNEYLKIFHT